MICGVVQLMSGRWGRFEKIGRSLTDGEIPAATRSGKVEGKRSTVDGQGEIRNTSASNEGPSKVTSIILGERHSKCGEEKGKIKDAQKFR